MNKYDFNLDLKTFTEGELRISNGKLFHSLGAAIANARSPRVIFVFIYVGFGGVFIDCKLDWCKHFRIIPYFRRGISWSPKIEVGTARAIIPTPILWNETNTFCYLQRKHWISWLIWCIIMTLKLSTTEYIIKSSKEY